MSSSMQLMLLAIHRAQLSSRKAIAPAVEQRKRRSDSDIA